MATTVLNVPDISCEHCEHTITNALLAVEGIRTINVDIPARQVSPGRYEAAVVADAGQTLSVSVKGDGPGNSDQPTSVTRTIVPDPVAEYRFGPPDEAMLKAIATATGGAWRPTPASLVNATGDQRTARRPLWPSLVAFALGLWFLDLLFRRIRVFEGGFVQQHTIYVTRDNGFVGQMDVCFIGYVRDGMISRIYEYFDTGQREKFLGPPD